MLPKSCSFHLRKLSSSCIGIPISLCSYSSCKKLGYQHKFIVSNPYLQTSLLHHILLLLNYVPHQWTKIITGPPNSWHGHLNCGLIICMYVYHYMYTHGMIHTHRHTHTFLRLKILVIQLHLNKIYYSNFEYLCSHHSISQLCVYLVRIINNSGTFRKILNLQNKYWDLMWFKFWFTKLKSIRSDFYRP